VSYYLIILPLAIWFTFYVGTHLKIIADIGLESEAIGMGQIGIWSAFAIGVFLLIIMQQVVILKVADWH
jgi:hypothetical protein